MAAVKNTKGKIFHRTLREGQAPEKCLESEGDKFIKTLFIKQTDKTLTLDKQFSQEKVFTGKKEFKPITECISGASKLNEFIGVVDKINAEDLLPSSSSLEDDSTLASSSGISRHERELALCVKPQSEATQLLHSMVLSQKTCATNCWPVGHPMNSLPELHDKIFPKEAPEIDLSKVSKMVKRKRRQMLDALGEPILVPEKPKKRTKPSPSLWDVRNEETILPSKVEFKKTCVLKQEKLFTIVDGKIVELDKNRKLMTGTHKSCELLNNTAGQPFICSGGTADSLPSKINSNIKLSLEEIKQIPKFSNYNEGKKSKILFIKNLARNINEADLINIFNKFQSPSLPKIVYRLMEGRMKGQAFVNFQCENIAEKALKETLGFIVKGKPLVIEYGKCDQNT